MSDWNGHSFNSRNPNGDEIELTGDDILESLVSEIEKAYSGTVVEKWAEREDESCQLWLCYALKDKIGIVKVPIETGGVVDE